jgi:LCP family protein required for cell wall assembly
MTPTLATRSERHRKRKKGKKQRRWLKGLLTLVFLFVAAVCIYIGYLYTEVNRILDRNVSTQPDKAVPREEQVDVKPLSMLLLGLDTRSNLGLLNTDVIMAVTMNPKTKTATLVSIPRDTYIQAEGYKSAKANSYYSAFYRQAEGDKQERAAHALQEVKELYAAYLDIPIDYAMTIDFEGFRQVIDALGGVDVYVDMDMKYVDKADGTNINLEQGQQVLNGEQALDFIRYRKSNNGETKPSNDFERNQRQKAVLMEAIHRLKSLRGLTKLDDIVSAAGDHWKTDMPASEIKRMLPTYIGMDVQNIEYVPLEGTWKSPYVHVDQNRLDQAREALRRQLSSGAE